jgi:hypothetical protein
MRLGLGPSDHGLCWPLEERAHSSLIDDEHHLLFDCQATASIWQRYVGLQQATKLGA